MCPALVYTHDLAAAALMAVFVGAQKTVNTIVSCVSVRVKNAHRIISFYSVAYIVIQ